MIVSNSGPIITFARAGRLDLLKKILKEVIIPEAVWHDVVVRGKTKPGSKEVKEADWIKRRQVADKTRISDFPGGLGEGEREKP